MIGVNVLSVVLVVYGVVPWWALPVVFVSSMIERMEYINAHNKLVQAIKIVNRRIGVNK